MTFVVLNKIIRIFQEWCDDNDVLYDDADVGMWYGELEELFEDIHDEEE